MNTKYGSFLLSVALVLGCFGCAPESVLADADATYREAVRAAFPAGGGLHLAGLRTADGYAVGDVWNSSGTLKVCLVTTTSTSSTSSTTSSSTTSTSSTTTTSTTSTSSTTAPH